MEDFNVEERAWMMGKIYRQIAEYFAHWQDSSFSREQLDDVYREYLGEGLAAPNRDNFVAVLKRWIARLHNGHSSCQDSACKTGSRLGFQLERLDNECVAIGSWINEVDAGDVIETIEGHSPDEWMTKAAPYLTVRQPKAMEAQWQYVLPSIWDVHEATLTIRKKDNKVREVSYQPFRQDVGDPRARKPKEHTEGRWVKEGAVAYIQIPSFNAPHYAEEALAYVQQFSSADTLIFDIRSNGGGNTPSSLTKAIMDQPYRWWTETASNIGHLRRRHPNNAQFMLLEDGTGARCPANWEEPTNCLYTGKVMVLAGRYTGSAAEDFLMPFKDTGRGVVIGESTWGSTGQPVFFNHRHVRVGIGSVRACLPDDTEFEGVGIQPDISVWRTRDDVYEGRDPVLEKALQLCSG